MTAQRIARGFLARKHHRPRYQGITKINKIRSNALKTIEIAHGLKLGRDEIVGGVNDIYRQIDDAINKIRVRPIVCLKKLTKYVFSIIAKYSHHPTRN